MDVGNTFVDGVLGSVLVLAIAQSGSVLTARRRERGEARASASASFTEKEDEDGGDLNLRWTVASVVGCIPLFAWCSWLLPTISLGSWDDEDARGMGKQKALAFAGAYLLAFAAHGFNPSDSALDTIDVDETAAIGTTRGEGKSLSDWASVDHHAPARSQKGKGMVLGLLNPRSQSSESTSTTASITGSTPVRSAVNVGRALGQVSVAAKQFGASVREGQMQAEIEQEALRTQQALAQESQILSGELEDWDVRFRLRTMTKPQLLDIARQKGLKRFSKLTKPQLIARLEREVIEQGKK
jgi:hypothetical protein